MIIVLFYIKAEYKKREKLKYYETYQPILRNMTEQLRKQQHNHTNAIYTMSQLSQTYSDYESLSNALNQYSNQLLTIAFPSHLLQLDNQFLSSLLYVKYCQAAELGITLSIMIKKTHFQSHISELDQVDIAGILIDNAIEASSKGDTVYVIIGDIHHNLWSISVKNIGPVATEEFIKNIFTKGYSTKEIDSPSHGIGLSILKSTVTKHKGTVSVTNEWLEAGEEQLLVITVVV